MPKYKTDYGTVQLPRVVNKRRMTPRHVPKHTQKLHGPASKKGMAEDLGKL